jgi:hypothetical protein
MIKITMTGFKHHMHNLLFSCRLYQGYPYPANLYVPDLLCGIATPRFGLFEILGVSGLFFEIPHPLDETCITPVASLKSYGINLARVTIKSNPNKS